MFNVVNSLFQDIQSTIVCHRICAEHVFRTSALHRVFQHQRGNKRFVKQLQPFTKRQSNLKTKAVIKFISRLFFTPSITQKVCVLNMSV